MARELSNNTKQKIDKWMRFLNNRARVEPEIWPPLFRAALTRAGFKTLKDWAYARPKEFFLFAEACSAEVDDGNEPQFSPDPETGRIPQEML